MIFDRTVKNSILLYVFCYERKQLKVDCRTKYGDARLSSILHYFSCGLSYQMKNAVFFFL